MKFSEKLSNLRKQNNKSQEQLADKLGVSRQAVSKWESGSSVPDMEKMMQLCKILNCSLDELVDDGVGGNSKQNSFDKLNWSIYYKEIIDFITKTLNMFWSMRLIEKIKCILEMVFLGLILFFIWRFIGNIIYSCFFSVLLLLPESVHTIIRAISSFIYQSFGLIIGFVLLVHIFKIRYLDYFITIEDENTIEKIKEVPIEEQEQVMKDELPRQFLEKKKNKIIIRDAKHSTYNFFGMLARLVIWFIKVLLGLFLIPCVLCFIGFIFLAVCLFLFIKNGVFFVGLFLIVMGAVLINYLILKMIYYFIFELKQKFQKIFILVIIGLVLMGIGGSISFCSYLSFDKMEINDIEQVTSSFELKYDDKMILSFQEDDNVIFKIDNNCDNIIIDVEHDKSKSNDIYFNQHYTTYINDEGRSVNTTYNLYYIDFWYKGINGIDEMNRILNLIKEKKRFVWQDNYDFNQVTITTSKEIHEKLENNYQNFYG